MGTSFSPSLLRWFKAVSCNLFKTFLINLCCAYWTTCWWGPETYCINFGTPKIIFHLGQMLILFFYVSQYWHTFWYQRLRWQVSCHHFLFYGFSRNLRLMVDGCSHVTGDLNSQCSDEAVFLLVQLISMAWLFKMNDVFS